MYASTFSRSVAIDVSALLSNLSLLTAAESCLINRCWVAEGGGVLAPTVSEMNLIETRERARDLIQLFFSASVACRLAIGRCARRLDSHSLVIKLKGSPGSVPGLSDAWSLRSGDLTRVGASSSVSGSGPWSPTHGTAPHRLDEQTG